MSMTDPIADMLNRIRNGIHARKNIVRMPASKMKVNIATILKDEGYISDYSLEEDDKQNSLVIKLRYLENGDSAIRSIKRVSTPGRRQYFTQDKIPWVMDGLGIFILSTNQGLLTDTKARRANVGGEGICMVW
jgi:small subunit ribosomal protein S8